MPESGTEPSCVDCQARAPAVDSFTLIGQDHGWRLSKANAKDGRDVIEWRCPECFAKRRSSNP